MCVTFLHQIGDPTSKLPELVTARRSILGPPAKGRPGPSPTKRSTRRSPPEVRNPPRKPSLEASCIGSPPHGKLCTILEGYWEDIKWYQDTKRTPFILRNFSLRFAMSCTKKKQVYFHILYFNLLVSNGRAARGAVWRNCTVNITAFVM